MSEVRNGKLVKYVYAGRNRVAKTNETSSKPFELIPTTFYLHDHLGSTNLSVSSDATAAEQMVNYPFGHPRVEKGIALINAANYKFTGKERDVESGLQYFEARYYAGYLGKFVSVDPLYSEVNKLNKEMLRSFLRNPQRINICFYADNNPVMNIDPNGKTSQRNNNTDNFLSYINGYKFLNYSIAPKIGIGLGVGTTTKKAYETKYKYGYDNVVNTSSGTGNKILDASIAALDTLTAGAFWSFYIGIKHPELFDKNIKWDMHSQAGIIGKHLGVQGNYYGTTGGFDIDGGSGHDLDNYLQPISGKNVGRIGKNVGNLKDIINYIPGPLSLQATDKEIKYILGYRYSF